MILGVLQARSSSTRFPRKVLQPLLGRAMVLRQIERIAQSQAIDQLVVATSVDSSDDELAKLLADSGITVRRGPLGDVVSRFAQVIDEFHPSQVVRLTADCPLADPVVIDRVIAEHLSQQCDYTSNVLPPTFPDGLDVEVFTAAAFHRLAASSLSEEEREHVTMGLYSRPESFTTWNVTQPVSHSELRWTVDVPEDLDFVQTIYERLYQTDTLFGQAEVIALLAEDPSLSRTNQDLARNSGLAKE